MLGPQPPGHWTKNLGALRNFQMLCVGYRYRVIQSFRDYDGDKHPVGEMWTFRGYNFAPHGDGLSLFVSIQNDEWHIRMQWLAESQADIINSPSTYLELVSNGDT